MPNFRKKPIVIQAVRWTGEVDQAFRDLVGADFADALGILAKQAPEPRQLAIETLEGTMVAQPGDWIIKGVKGELYPCKHDIFEATYEAV